ncbi:alpha,alpha-phosphotrehalase [Bifidobacterium sp. MA2]|uniref:Alpha,alpha-phosphotrehalase n=1 Tax=Bifidobacterium santillanense TaxID=2809028 RepID=A0ABS5US40_9BIFI|nr:alpha,alpha-phosphotrehalase [Bifidobacterium santillanense]MBT1173744.1 alpha,alpha-phosphotrehalase [Bifidobacterium santillanense]
MTFTTDFHKAVVYQIYPKSFADSNGDGLGDLKGVIGKLDYIAGLGADYIWSTPFFVSPQHDNGYDVADYYDVDPAYGTMDDVDELIAEAGKRGIGLMFDMVFNHVSTEHEWFRKAMAGDPYYKRFFFFRKGKGPGVPPTNWESKFGGPAWRYVPEFDEWYLHLFDPTQADLDWENPDVRHAVQDIVRFWMSKGVRGFRFDVINLISKAGFEDDPDGGDGRAFYTDGPRVHEYLRELNEATFGTDPGIITVGEMSSTSMEQCYRYAGADTHELSMVFSFHHLKVDFMGNEKWVLVPPDFGRLKRIVFDWQTNMAAHDAWNAVFWCNHDQPRVVSRFGDEGRYWKESAKMLATVMHCLRGTPYVYQGEELGMTNADYDSIEQFRDVESLNHYEILQRKGLKAADALRIIQVHSRDNSRTPMQWDDSRYAGFEPADATAEPWLAVNANHDRINAAAELADPDSIYHYYRKLIALRKELDVIAFGDVEPIATDDPDVFAYRRRWQGHELIMVANFHGHEREWTGAEVPDVSGFERVLGNYANGPAIDGGVWQLRPYETSVWYR